MNKNVEQMASMASTDKMKSKCSNLKKHAHKTGIPVLKERQTKPLEQQFS